MKETKLKLIQQQPEYLPQPQFVTVIVPVALPKLYTYSIPFHFKEALKVGVRVEVQFGRNKLYSALVYKIHAKPPEGYAAKPILNILDLEPIVSLSQLKLWEWMSQYYACTMGEVMNAALPAGLKLTSESKILLRPDFTEEQFEREDLSEKEYIILQALYNRIELSIGQIRDLIDQKTVYQPIKRLMQKGLIFAKESLKSKYSPKTMDIIHLSEPYKSDSSQLEQAFEIIGQRAMKQATTLLSFLQLSKEYKQVKKSDLYQRAGIGASLLKKLVDKKILTVEAVEISRLSEYDAALIAHNHLSEVQMNCLASIQDYFKSKAVVLLHGVTGSGKTQVYIELIEAIIAKGQQVLYLLPEIALTTQIVSRLQKYFGDKIVVSHSKFNNNERVEIWQRVLDGVPLILGARSALFMPFQNLGLIIVDEEHDPSYKQNDPAPRYNARDTSKLLDNGFISKL
jgi:primosomal protein N' (replication factor Y)